MRDRDAGNRRVPRKVRDRLNCPVSTKISAIPISTPRLKASRTFFYHVRSQGTSSAIPSDLSQERSQGSKRSHRTPFFPDDLFGKELGMVASSLTDRLFQRRDLDARWQGCFPEIAERIHRRPLSLFRVDRQTKVPEISVKRQTWHSIEQFGDYDEREGVAKGEFFGP